MRRWVARRGALNISDPVTEDTLVSDNSAMYYGACRERPERNDRHRVSGSVSVSLQDDLSACPNFILTVQGVDAELGLTQVRACDYGAFYARVLHSLESRGSDPLPTRNNASVLTSLYHGGTLRMYTVHCVNADGQLDVYVNQLRCFAMIDTEEAFTEGCTWYRNGIEWAEERRKEAIGRANTITSGVDWTQMEYAERCSSTSGSRYATPISGDETSQTMLSLKQTDEPTTQELARSKTTKRSHGHAMVFDAMTRKRNCRDCGTAPSTSDAVPLDRSEDRTRDVDDDSDDRTELLDSGDEVWNRRIAMLREQTGSDEPEPIQSVASGG